MGNRKKNKYTKRVLKSIKVQRLTEYHRKKKEELEDYGQFPAEDAGESNFDAGFDTLPEVLDIKVEEPEVTCQFEDDYPAILLDHSYSRIDVKDEPDWTDEYIANISSTKVQTPTSTYEPPISIKYEDDYQPLPAQNSNPASSSEDQNSPIVSELAQLVSRIPTRVTPVESKKISLPSDHNYTRTADKFNSWKSRFFADDANQTPPTIGTNSQNLIPPKSPRKRGSKPKTKLDTPSDNLRRSPRISKPVLINPPVAVVPPPPSTFAQQQVQFNWKDFVLGEDTNNVQSLVGSLDILPVPIRNKPNPGCSQSNLAPTILIPNIYQHLPGTSTNTTNAMSQTGNITYQVPLAGQPGSLTAANPVPSIHLINYIAIPTTATSQVRNVTPPKNPGKFNFVTSQPKPNSTVVSNNPEDLQHPSYITPTIEGPPTPSNQPQYNLKELSRALTAWIEKSTDVPHNKMIKVESKDRKFCKIFKVKHISSAPKKSVGGLRVKTQDELNASAVISPNTNQAPNLGMPPEQKDGAPQRIVQFVEYKAKSKLKSYTRRTKVVKTASANKDKRMMISDNAKTSQKTVPANEDRLLTISDNVKTFRHPLMPTERMLEKVPSFWKSRMENPPTPCTMISNPVANSIVGSGTNLRKDVTGKKIKGIGRSMLSETAQQSSEPPQTNQGGDIEDAVPSFVVPNMLAAKNHPNRFFTKNSDGSIAIHVQDDDADANPATSLAKPPNMTEGNTQRPLKETNRFQTTISECVDNIILNLLDDADDVEEVGVLRVDLDEPISNLGDNRRNHAVVRNAEDFQNLDIESYIPATSILITAGQSAGGKVRKSEGSNSTAERDNCAVATTNTGSEPATNPPPIQTGDSNALAASEPGNVRPKPSTSKRLNLLKTYLERCKNSRKSEEELQEDPPSIENKPKKRVIISLANLDDNSSKNVPENVVSLSLTPTNPKVTPPEQDLIRKIPVSQEEEEAQNEEELPIIEIQDVEALLGGSAEQNDSSDDHDVAAILGAKYTQPAVVLHRISQEEIIQHSSPIKSKPKQESRQIRRRRKSGNASPTKEPKLEDVQTMEEDPDYARSPSTRQTQRYFNQRRSARLSKRSPQMRASPDQVSDHENVGISIEDQTMDADVIVKSEPEIHITGLLVTPNSTYCNLCRMECQNLSSHLQTVHFSKEEIILFQKSSKGSDTRREILKKWYLIGNYEAAVTDGSKCFKRNATCSLCLRKISMTELPGSHYIQCESSNSPNINLSSVSADAIDADLDRLIAELQAECSPKTWQDLAKSVLISLYFFNGKVSFVDRLRTSDYVLRRPVDVESDSLLLEMVQDRLTVTDFSQLKVVMYKYVVSLPLFLNSKHEEAINLLLDQRDAADYYHGKAKRQYCYVFTDSLSGTNNRITIEVALGNRTTKVVEGPPQNQVSTAKRRKNGHGKRLRLTRRKGKKQSNSTSKNMKLKKSEMLNAGVENEAIAEIVVEDSNDAVVEPNPEAAVVSTSVGTAVVVEDSNDVGVAPNPKGAVFSTSVAVETEPPVVEDSNDAGVQPNPEAAVVRTSVVADTTSYYHGKDKPPYDYVLTDSLNGTNTGITLEDDLGNRTTTVVEGPDQNQVSTAEQRKKRRRNGKGVMLTLRKGKKHSRKTPKNIELNKSDMLNAGVQNETIDEIVVEDSNDAVIELNPEAAVVSTFVPVVVEDSDDAMVEPNPDAEIVSSPLAVVLNDLDDIRIEPSPEVAVVSTSVAVNAANYDHGNDKPLYDYVFTDSPNGTDTRPTFEDASGSRTIKVVEDPDQNQISTAKRRKKRNPSGQGKRLKLTRRKGKKQSSSTSKNMKLKKSEMLNAAVENEAIDEIVVEDSNDAVVELNPEAAVVSTFVPVVVEDSDDAIVEPNPEAEIVSTPLAVVVNDLDDIRIEPNPEVAVVSTSVAVNAANYDHGNDKPLYDYVFTDSLNGTNTRPTLEDASGSRTIKVVEDPEQNQISTAKRRKKRNPSGQGKRLKLTLRKGKKHSRKTPKNIELNKSDMLNAGVENETIDEIVVEDSNDAVVEPNPEAELVSTSVCTAVVVEDSNDAAVEPNPEAEIVSTPLAVVVNDLDDIRIEPNPEVAVVSTSVAVDAANYYHGNDKPLHDYAFTDSLNGTNTRPTLEDASGSRTIKLVEDPDQNQISTAKRRKKRNPTGQGKRLKLTRRKGKKHSRKTPKNIELNKSDMLNAGVQNETIDEIVVEDSNDAVVDPNPEAAVVSTSVCTAVVAEDSNDAVVEPNPEAAVVSTPLAVVVDDIRIEPNPEMAVVSTSVAVETEPPVQPKIQSEEKGTQLKLKSVVVSSYKDNDNSKNIYLKTTNNPSNMKRNLKISFDVRDLCVCKRCRKYFLKSYYRKHLKRCSVETTPSTRKRKLNSTKSGSKDSKDVKYRGRVSTCPTLQSAAGVKKYFCIFCKQTFTKLNRHLEHKHNDQEEVQEMLKYPKRSREREQILYRLRTKGTFAFNKNSELNGGKIIVSRRPHPTLQRTSTDFLPCPSCGNYFAKKTLYRHSKRCSKKEGLQKDLRRTALALVNRAHPRCNKIMANQIIPRLVDDNVSEAIKNDELLILFGNHLTSKHHTPYIRQNLRIAGKLFLAMKNLDVSIKEFSTAYNAEYCEVVIKSVMEVAGYNAETSSFKLPEIAKKLGRIIKNCGEIWSVDCTRSKRLENREVVAEFLRKFEEAYKVEVLAKLAPRSSLKNQNNELRKMFQFSQDRMVESAERLKEDFSYEIWNDLANSLLVHLRLLNNNIPQDGAALYVSDYLQRHGLDSDEDSINYHNLGLLNNFPKNYLKIKLHATSIWLLVSQEFCSAMDVLLENREDAGVPIENVYLFGCPEDKDRYLKIRDAKNYLRVKASSLTHTEAAPQEEGDSTVTIYANNLRKAYDYHSSRMVELTAELTAKFSNQIWIELVKCVLNCVQLTNDKTFAEVVQYLLLIDYSEKELVPAGEDLSEFNSLSDLSEDCFKLRMRGTPITLLVTSPICKALDLLIQTRIPAGIDRENPYVFGCSGNKYNYYRTEGCIGSLPVTDGVDEILPLRSRIINDMIKNGSPGIQLEKLLPETKADLLDNTKKVFHYSGARMTELKHKLEDKFSLEIWLELIRCLLTYIHLLNNRIPEDVEKLLIAQYNQRSPHHDYNDDRAIYHNLTHLNDFPRNYLKARLDDGYLLLSSDFCNTMDVLLTYRQDAGVHADNPYVFGCRGNKENYFRAHGIIAQVAAKCGVKRLKYDKAKRINGKVEMQEQTVDVKDISRAEREILLNNWKIDSIFRSADKTLTPRTKQRDSSAIPRRRWSETEMACAAHNFTNCLTKGYLPSVYQCQQVIADNVELGSRTPEQLKAWVNNQIQKRVRKGILPEPNNPTRTASGSSARLTDAAPPIVSKRAPRVRWSDVEQDLVRLYFADYLMSSTLPSASECRKVISQHVELAKRTPEQMRAWINNKNKKRNVVQ